MQPFGEAVTRLKAAYPTLHVVLAVADPVEAETRAALEAWSVKPHLVQGEAARMDAMRGATLALACSGTVTTELALAGCPMVVAYRLSPLTYILVKLVARIRYASLINIASGRMVAPELLQWNCTGPKLAKALSALLGDPARRERQVAEQTAALAKLGARTGTDPSERAADAVIAILEGRRP